jgi:hypothetical protein
MRGKTVALDALVSAKARTKDDYTVKQLDGYQS